MARFRHAWHDSLGITHRFKPTLPGAQLDLGAVGGTYGRRFHFTRGPPYLRSTIIASNKIYDSAWLRKEVVVTNWANALEQRTQERKVHGYEIDEKKDRHTQMTLHIFGEPNQDGGPRKQCNRVP